MARRSREWVVHRHDEAAIRALAAAARVSDVLAQVLLNRGIDTAERAARYLDASMMNLYEPMSLPGLRPAAERLLDAIRGGEPICIFGDYDTDGLTGTAILVNLIERLGGRAEFHIPHRLTDGYGLNAEAVRQRREQGDTLMVTVDCGITAVEETALARQLGLDLIITDHHEPKDALPDALIVHPHLPGSDYPFAGLSGSGVALKLAWGVCQLASAAERVTPELREFLLDATGLAALGLVADVVPLRDENRILVRHGLRRLAANPPLGIRALINVAQLKQPGLRSEDVSFRIAPRLNAAGRLGCAMLVVELLTTTNPARASELAMALDGFNTQRQTIERRISHEARELVETEQLHDAPAIVLGHPDWHPGVVGIVAGRLVELFGRPVILLALRPDGQLATGSGRSVPGLPLHEALADCAGALAGYGGHAMAAGLRLAPERLPAFRQQFCDAVQRRLQGEAPAPTLALDAEVPLAAMTLNLLRDLDCLEPFGSENPRPRFMAAGVKLDGEPRKVGQGERHISFKVRQGNTWLRAIAFGQGDRFDELASASEFDLAFAPKLNEWNGSRSVQLEVIDFRPA